MQEIGKILVVFGALIVLLGLAVWSGSGAEWLGRLSGDMDRAREFHVLFPNRHLFDSRA